VSGLTTDWDSVSASVIARALFDQLRDLLPQDVSMVLDGDVRIVLSADPPGRSVFDVALIVDQETGRREDHVLAAVWGFVSSLQDVMVLHTRAPWPDPTKLNIDLPHAWFENGFLYAGFGQTAADSTTLVSMDLRS